MYTGCRGQRPSETEDHRGVLGNESLHEVQVGGYMSLVPIVVRMGTFSRSSSARQAEPELGSSLRVRCSGSVSYLPPLPPYLVSTYLGTYLPR